MFRRRAAALAAALLACSGTAFAASASDPALAAPRAVSASAWSVSAPVCGEPADPHAFRCYAQVQVDVAKGTAGATHHALAKVGHGPTGGYSPVDLRNAYGYGFGRNGGSGQTVAIVDWYDDPYARADLNVFDRHYGLPAETSTSFRKVNQNGATSPLPRASRDLSGEIALDVQSVRGVCPKCRILLVEANSPTSANLAAAENTAARLGATEISNSWGGGEGGEGTALRDAFKHPGVVITASTGDDGWYGWDHVNTGDMGDDAASFPATSPYVVAVGGTALTLTSNATRAAETVWNENGASDTTGTQRARALGASGGGCSRSQTAPTWQAHVAGYSSLGCRGHRSSTDLAVDGAPAYGYDVFDRYGTPLFNSACHTDAPTNACWARVGGTSLSSPIVAAMYALAGGSGGSAYPAASLYVNANRAAGLRYDVTTGGNAYCGTDATATCAGNVYPRSGFATNNPNGLTGDLLDCSFRGDGQSINTFSPPARSPQCNARPGFDGPSGIGTPRGLGLFADTSPNATIYLPSGVKRGSKHTYRATLATTRGARIVAVSWSWGDGHSTSGSASAARVTHAYSKAGTYRLTFVARDSFGQLIYRYRTVRVK